MNGYNHQYSHWQQFLYVLLLFLHVIFLCLIGYLGVSCMMPANSSQYLNIYVQSNTHTQFDIHTKTQTHSHTNKYTHIHTHIQTLIHKNKDKLIHKKKPGHTNT